MQCLVGSAKSREGLRFSFVLTVSMITACLTTCMAVGSWSLAFGIDLAFGELHVGLGLSDRGCLTELMSTLRLYHTR